MHDLGGFPKNHLGHIAVSRQGVLLPDYTSGPTRESSNQPPGAAGKGETEKSRRLIADQVPG